MQSGGVQHVIAQSGGYLALAMVAAYIFSFFVHKTKSNALIALNWLGYALSTFFNISGYWLGWRYSAWIDVTSAFLLIMGALTFNREAVGRGFRWAPWLLLSGALTAVSVNQQYLTLHSLPDDVLAHEITTWLRSLACFVLAYRFLRGTDGKLLMMLRAGEKSPAGTQKETFSRPLVTSLEIVSAIDESIQNYLEFGRISLFAGYLAWGCLSFTELIRFTGSSGPSNIIFSSIAMSAQFSILAGLVQVLVADYRERNASLRSRSVLEDLGILIRGPLQPTTTVGYWLR